MPLTLDIDQTSNCLH